jgi:hypothetical protein
VNRYAAGAKQLVNASEPSLAPLANLEHAPRCLTQRDQSANESNEEGFVPAVKRNVEKD